MIMSARPSPMIMSALTTPNDHVSPCHVSIRFNLILQYVPSLTGGSQEQQQQPPMVPPHLVQPGSSSPVLLLPGYTKQRATPGGSCIDIGAGIRFNLIFQYLYLQEAPKNNSSNLLLWCLPTWCNLEVVVLSNLLQCNLKLSIIATMLLSKPLHQVCRLQILHSEFEL